MTSESADGLGTQLRRLVELLDGHLEEVYNRDGFGYRPRYTPVMKALSTGAQRTIKDIAALSSISHSAASQTISRMMAEGLVEQSIGDDGRERLIGLTANGKELLPLLKARWNATRKAASQLDSELSTPLSSVLAEAIEALTARPFSARIADQVKK
jgi:DNA-binding MarR family transcriptional regulator